MKLSRPLSLLAIRANPICVEIIESDDTAVSVNYTLRLPDGRMRRFRLQIEPDNSGRGVTVRELAPEVLPSSCPERHINRNGTFCLGLKGADEPNLTTIKGADQWWARLAGYLMLQVFAETTGKWPKDCAWPHGDAADDQHTLEQSLAVNPWLAVWAAKGWSVTARGRIERRRAPCPCGSGIQTRHCHEKMLIDVIVRQNYIIERENEFYRQWDVPCCGTMALCGVRHKEILGKESNAGEI